jgi:glycosyltransferase involved in cell wall biosynthesis
VGVRILLTADAEVPVPPKLYGGIERVIDLLVGEFEQRGHAVGLAANRESTSSPSEFFPWPDDHSVGSRAAFRNGAALRRAVKAFAPDVIHSFSRLMWLLPLVGDGRPRIMSFQREPTGRTIRLSRYLHHEKLHFTGCSEYICENGRRRGGGDWTGIHNGVSAKAYAFRAAVPANAPLVFLSRIEPIKGCLEAIEIAKRSRRRLVIAGNHGEEGELGSYWRDRILPEIGRNGIEYAGPVDDRQKNELLGGAAAMLVPVQWNEPFGIVFAESLACGTPVISAPRGALPEIIDNGVEGFLIRSIDEGVEAVERIGTIDRAACRSKFERSFSSAVIADKYLTLYQRLVDQHRRRASA